MTHLLSTLLFLAFLVHTPARTLENNQSLNHSLKRQSPVLYNITASDTHRFVWFRVAKNGTRTMLNIFQKYIPLSVNDFKVPYRSKDYEGYFKFAFVRNPWDRVVSCYCNKVLPKNHNAFQECFDKDFDYFVNFINKQDLHLTDPHIRLQSTLFPLNEVDFIGRFETYTQDLKYILSLFNLDHVPIDKKNFTNRQHYSTFYNEKTKNIIAKKYKLDIDNFDYFFEYE